MNKRSVFGIVMALVGLGFLLVSAIAQLRSNAAFDDKCKDLAFKRGVYFETWHGNMGQRCVFKIGDTYQFADVE